MESDDILAALLTVEEVARHLGVRPVTVYRWCRDGRLPAIKAGKGWRIRRTTLADFIRRGERSPTLAGLLTSFLTMPDHVLAIAPTMDLLHRLDAAFFQVGEAHGGLLVKSYTGEVTSVDELRAALMRDGFDVAALEAAGRFQFTAEVDPQTGRADELQRWAAQAVAEGRSIWVSFNWVKAVTLEEALRQQNALAPVVSSAPLVVKTAVLEEVIDTWPPGTQHRAQALHRGTIWIAPTGVLLSRLSPLPPA